VFHVGSKTGIFHFTLSKYRSMPFYVVSLVFFSILFSAGASAERADRDKPIHLEADRATVEDYKRRGDFRTSIFTGNVVLTQGTLIIRADKIIMKEDSVGYRYATAHGNLVSFRQKRDGVDEYVEAWGKRVEYDDKTDKIELFGNARLKRGDDEVEGDYISYDITRDFFQVIGQFQQENDKSSGHRVRAVIQPRTKQPSEETEE
jgi:lipopolysaccharide export system protein LptA